jgi:acetyl esterase/lipase
MRPAAFFNVVLLLLSAWSASRAAETDLTVGEAEFRKAIGREAPVVRLWPRGQAPDEPRPIGAEVFRTTDEKRGRTGLLNITNVVDPSMTILSPPEGKNTGVALILCPGGGYGSLGTETVKETAEWLNPRGVTVVFLKYRVPKRHAGFAMNHQPLQDAQRATGILRSRAKEWGIDPGKIGVGGFSAGGHLAASLAVNHAGRSYEPLDAFDRVSCRPDFAVLLYPAYLTDPILSRQRDPALHYDRINARDTPPTLISITRPDKFTIGSVEFYQALADAGVSAELHVYPEGGHGGAIAKYPFGEWAKEFSRFLGDHGFLKPAERPAPSIYAGAAAIEAVAAVEPGGGLTAGDLAIRRVLGRDCPLVPVWPRRTGPDDVLEAAAERVATLPNRGNALSIRDVTRPTLTVVQPPQSKRNRLAVIVCPGGGYGQLAAEHEGTRACEWLNELGITAFLLKYRVPRRDGQFVKHQHALQDLQRSVRLVRSEADRWGIDPRQVGVCGFSAGGHLCAVLCTNFARDAYAPIDGADKRSSRPDFGILVYPAYLTEPRTSNDVDPLVKDLRRNATPPLFLAAARDDSFTRGMLSFYLDVREAKVPAECHVYAGGRHGGGLDPASYPASDWTNACARWLGDLEDLEGIAVKLPMVEELALVPPRQRARRTVD